MLLPSSHLCRKEFLLLPLLFYKLLQQQKLLAVVRELVVRTGTLAFTFLHLIIVVLLRIHWIMTLLSLGILATHLLFITIVFVVIRWVEFVALRRVLASLLQGCL